eukprot:scaffold3269_cov112-Skeletonema_dohrnii-CCMP3373.AAC.6
MSSRRRLRRFVVAFADSFADMSTVRLTMRHLVPADAALEPRGQYYCTAEAATETRRMTQLLMVVVAAFSLSSDSYRAYPRSYLHCYS